MRANAYCMFMLINAHRRILSLPSPASLVCEHPSWSLHFSSKSNLPKWASRPFPTLASHRYSSTIETWPTVKKSLRARAQSTSLCGGPVYRVSLMYHGVLTLNPTTFSPSETSATLNSIKNSGQQCRFPAQAFSHSS
jgi:hypothetical protein